MFAEKRTSGKAEIEITLPAKMLRWPRTIYIYICGYIEHVQVHDKSPPSTWAHQKDSQDSQDSRTHSQLEHKKKQLSVESNLKRH